VTSHASAELEGDMNLFILVLLALVHHVHGTQSLRRRVATTVLGLSSVLSPLSIALLSQPTVVLADGISRIDGEPLRIYTKALQTMSDGDFVAAQKFFEEVVDVEPDFIFAWSNLGNVLVSQGYLDQGLLCYKKALSLKPVGEQLGVIYLNTATTELSLNLVDAAVKDLSRAEMAAGSTPTILTNKAVALTQNGAWKEGCDIFEQVFSSADRNASPWWLRYSMSLLETNRGAEAVAYLQRTLNRFPYESECKAFATALYTSMASPAEAQRYWKDMKAEERIQYSDTQFINEKLHWGPVAQKSLKLFLGSNFAKID
jgi:tetratricopeptide (TPR) repeat protein